MPACRSLIAAVLLSSPAFPAAPMPRSESISLETVTVIATRTVRSLDELASTVSVKTADDLERELARDISDLVRFEPGGNGGRCRQPIRPGRIQHPRHRRKPRADDD